MEPSILVTFEYEGQTVQALIPKSDFRDSDLQTLLATHLTGAIFEIRRLIEK